MVRVSNHEVAALSPLCHRARLAAFRVLLLADAAASLLSHLSCRWIARAVHGADYLVYFGNRFAHSSSNAQGVTCTKMAAALVAFLGRVTGKPVYMAPDHTGKHDDAARRGVVRDVLCMTRSRMLVITTPASTFAQWLAHLHSGCHAYVPAPSTGPAPVAKVPNLHHVGFDPATDTLAAHQGPLWEQIKRNATAVVALWSATPRI